MPSIREVSETENCPEDDCEANIHIRRHDRNPKFDTEAAANVIEAVCPIDGIVSEA